MSTGATREDDDDCDVQAFTSRIGSGVSENEANRHSGRFGRFAAGIAILAGRPAAFVLACVAILVWAVSGPVFGWSDTWQLVINTGTTIVTFLMVFVIQNAQNRDGMAIQVKLDELIRVTSRASNRLVGIEDLDDEAVERLKRELSRRAAREDDAA